jgi:hypothetical protein
MVVIEGLFELEGSPVGPQFSPIPVKKTPIATENPKDEKKSKKLKFGNFPILGRLKSPLRK